MKETEQMQYLRFGICFLAFHSMLDVRCWMFDVHLSPVFGFSFDVGRSMFDVGRSSSKQVMATTASDRA